MGNPDGNPQGTSAPVAIVTGGFIICHAACSSCLAFNLLTIAFVLSSVHVPVSFSSTHCFNSYFTVSSLQCFSMKSKHCLYPKSDSAISLLWYFLRENQDFVIVFRGVVLIVAVQIILNSNSRVSIGMAF